MQKRKFDEMISYFNCKVSDMYIDRKYKIELFAMIAAIGMAHEKELDAQPEIIRCKDCVRYGEPECLMAYDGKQWAEADGFCHAGERGKQDE